MVTQQESTFRNATHVRLTSILPATGDHNPDPRALYRFDFVLTPEERLTLQRISAGIVGTHVLPLADQQVTPHEMVCLYIDDSNNDEEVEAIAAEFLTEVHRALCQVPNR